MRDEDIAKASVPFPVVPGVQFRLIAVGYVAGSDGTVWSCRPQGASRNALPAYRKLAICNDSYGYPIVHIRRDGKSRTQTVHRLVATAFIPNPQNKPTVNHLNGIKTDNRTCNLEWATVSENTSHAFRTGLINVSHGERHYNRKLTEQDVLTIRRRVANGETNSALAIEYGVCQPQISRVSRGKRWARAGKETENPTIT